MKRILFSAFLLFVALIGIQAQLLWKISGNGLSKPSYIIGTYHLAPASFADSIPGLKKAARQDSESPSLTSCMQPSEAPCWA